MKTNKNLKLLLLLSLSAGYHTAFGMNNDQITDKNNLDLNNLKVISEETILQQDVCLYILPKKQKREIARIEYTLDDPYTLYLNHIGIHYPLHCGKDLWLNSRRFEVVWHNSKLPDAKTNDTFIQSKL